MATTAVICAEGVFSKKYLFPRELGRIESIAEFHADIPWGTDKKKKVEVYIQPNVDLNAEMETLEKVTLNTMRFGIHNCY